MDPERLRRAVRDRYGEIAQAGSSGCGCDCCSPHDLVTISRTTGYSPDSPDSPLAEANLGLGCGNPVALADLSEGETVLDLGSGPGYDCFLASEKVGPAGKVIGVDMTPEMVQRARKTAVTGGYTNVEFRLGEIEALPVADSSVDVVISNCVLNLSPYRERVFSELFRVLKPGGRAVISDLISSRATPAALLESPEAFVTCLPVQEDEYLRAFERAGLVEVSITDRRPFLHGLPTQASGAQAFLKGPALPEEELQTFLQSIEAAILRARKPLHANGTG